MEKIRDIAAKWGIEPEYIREIKKNVWEIFTPEGSYALKASTLKTAKLDFIAEAQKCLDRNGFQYFARPILYRGNSCLRQSDCLYTLYDWIEGEKCDFDNLSHLSAAASSLAQFHLYARDEDLINHNGAKPSYYLWPEKINIRIRDLEEFHSIAAMEHSDFFSKMFLGFFAPFLDKAYQARRLLLSSSYPKMAEDSHRVGTFIHYDVAARNFIIQKNHAYLIDFDYCTLDMPIVDLMRLIKRSLKYGAAPEQKINAIIDSYCAVRPLKQEEWQVLYALLLFPQKYWRLSARYYRNETDWSQETFTKKIRAVVTELENEDLWLPILRQKIGLE